MKQGSLGRKPKSKENYRCPTQWHRTPQRRNSDIGLNSTGLQSAGLTSIGINSIRLDSLRLLSQRVMCFACRVLLIAFASITTLAFASITTLAHCFLRASRVAHCICIDNHTCSLRSHRQPHFHGPPTHKNGLIRKFGCKSLLSVQCAA